MKFVILQVKGNILFQSNWKVSALKVSSIGSAIMQVVAKKRKKKKKKRGNIFTVANLLYWCQIEIEYRAASVSLCQWYSAYVAATAAKNIVIPRTI